MKLITAVVNKDDSMSVQTGLRSHGFQVTRIATTGGFLLSGNVTFLIGVEDDNVETVLDILAELSSQRRQLVPPVSAYGSSLETAYPIEVVAGGATVFVQDVERFEKV